MCKLALQTAEYLGLTTIAAPTRGLAVAFHTARLLFPRADHYFVGYVFLLTSYLLSIKFGA